MGDVVKVNKCSAWWQYPLAVLLLVALAAACSSGPPPQAPEPAAPSAEPAPAPSAPATPTPAAVVVESAELREGAPGMILDLEASGPLVWTSYRDAEGNLVVELPNSSPEEELTGEYSGEGLVASMTIEAERVGTRPLTRITVATAREVEHSLSAEGHRLRLELLPVAEVGADVTYEPVAEGVETAAAPAPAPQEPMLPPAAPAPAAAEVDLGTADAPHSGPAPAGPVASQLRQVEVRNDGSVLVAGDGEFAFESFRLENPERFVIDLLGVVNAAPVKVVPVEGRWVDQVRTAQFKPFPEPVSRVVFDLSGPALPVVEPSPTGLVVRFAPLTAEAEPGMAEPTPAEMEAERAEAEPMAQEEEMAAAAAPPMIEVEAEPMQEPAEPSMMEPAAGEAEMETADIGAFEVEEPVAVPAPLPVPRLEEPPVAEPEPGRVTIVGQQPAPAPSDAGGPQLDASTASDLALYAAENDEGAGPAEGGTIYATKVFGGQTIEGAERTYVGEPISMSVRDADVVETLRTFSAISGLSIVVQPQVEGLVTVELENVPWDQALEQILKINGLGYELEGTIMRIAPVGVLKDEAQQQADLAAAKALQLPLRTVMRRLSYAEAGEAAGLLSGTGGLLSQRGSVIIDRRTNTLIIKELPQYMDTVLAILDEIDTPEPQVMIEARIIETTKRFTRSLGVEWAVSGVASAEYGNTTGLTFPNNIAGSGGVSLVTGAENGFLNLSLGNVLNSFNIDVALQAAETEGLIKILSAPKVAVLNNEAANIQSGLQIPIQTIANNTVTVQFINATLSLDVTPHVTAEGTVLMDIEIRKREPQLAFAVAGAANAPIATKEARTRVIVRDGGTTVIGGIYEVSTDQGEDRVPGLANIPIIGHLFKNKRRSDENEELLIFITPRVVNL